MVKEMLINVSEGEECRIALIEDGRLEELYMERTSSTSHVGNIYKGRVTNVEPSIQAAFIDFGLGRNGFLHISDLMPTYFGGKAEDVQESVGRKMARRDRPPIQSCLRRGDEIVVQIIKEGIGTKGPTLSTYLAIPGRILVMMPGMARMGVSRKIEDEVERRRLRQILDSLEPPKDVGFIIRTAGVGKTKAEIQRDLTYLTRLWQNFAKKRDSGPGPMELYTEGDLVSRTVRDVFTSDVERIIVDNKEVAKRIKEVVKLANPRTKNKVDLYEEPIPLFHKYGIESQIEQMHSRHVPLRSGGSLVIDSTEAIVAIDVNSGKFRDHSDAETTAFKTDMEAADEIPRQLRLRDLGGVIICDFIDLRYERHRRDLEQRLHDNFQNDRAKTRVLRMSQFGIIEITRQRMRPSLKRSIYFDCPHCKGAGLVKTPESMSLDAMRRLAIAANDARVVRVEMAVSPDVAFHLQNRKRQAIADLEAHTKKRIIVKPDVTLALDEVKLQLFDIREGMVYLADLGMSPQAPEGTESPQRGRGGRRNDRGPRRGLPPQPRGAMPLPHRRDEEDDSHSMDRVEQAVEEREEEIEGAAPQAHEPGDEAPGAVAEPIRGPVARPAGGPGFDAPPGQMPLPGEGGGRRRRRRRRGRRGRGGGGGGGGGGGVGGPMNDGGTFDSNSDEADAPIPAMELPVPMDGPPEIEEPEVDGNRADYSQPPAGGLRPDQGEGGHRRRRRRRGGRGRNRGGNRPPALPGAQMDFSDGPPHVPPHVPPPPAEIESPEEENPRRRPRRKPPSIENTAAPRAAVVAEKVVRTGSADKHLVRDEPVAPQPVTRPRSVRDLDDIPDDFD